MEELYASALSERYLGVELAAAYLDVSVTSIGRYVRDGHLAAKRRWTKEELDAMVLPRKRGRSKKPAAAPPAAEPVATNQAAPGTSSGDGAEGLPPPRPSRDPAPPAPPAAPSAAPPAPARKAAEINPADPHQVNLPRPSAAKRVDPNGSAPKSAPAPRPGVKRPKEQDAKSGQAPPSAPKEWWWE